MYDDMNDNCKPARQPQMSREMDFLQSELDILCKNIERLEERLLMVLGLPEAVKEDVEIVDKKQRLVPFAENIMSIRKELIRQSRKISDITQRVEI